MLLDLIHLSLARVGIGDDGFIALVSATEHKTSLLQLDLCHSSGFSKRFFALADSSSEIKVLQRFGFSWCAGLTLAKSLLLAVLHKNKSLSHFHVTGPLVQPASEEAARCAGRQMQEMDCLGGTGATFSLSACAGPGTNVP